MTSAAGRIFGGCAETRCSHVRRLSIRLPLTPYLSPHSFSLSISHCPSTISSTRSSQPPLLLPWAYPSLSLASVWLMTCERTRIFPPSVYLLFFIVELIPNHTVHTRINTYVRVCVCAYIYNGTWMYILSDSYRERGSFSRFCVASGRRMRQVSFKPNDNKFDYTE